MTARERPAPSRRPLLRSLALTAQTVREHVTDDPVLLALQVSRRLPPALAGGAADILTRVGRNGVVPALGHEMRGCLLYTSPSPRDLSTSRMPSSA